MAVFRVIPTGDLVIVGGRPQMLDGPAYIRQKLSVRFKFFLGEWFLDKRQGVPYYRDVFVKEPKLDVIRSLFSRIVLGCPGVLSLTSFRIAFDEPNRQLSFDFQAKVSGGDVVVTPQDRDFLLDIAA